nr:A-kinase anchor protein 13 isoform X3 [Nothobranchius furzeri]
MKLNPQQAPLYGRCLVTVQLSDDELAADGEGVDYFLLFAGSTQRHVTSTLRSSHDTLQALCPAHDCCEVVLVTLCLATQNTSEASEDHPGHVAPLAKHRFSFVQDLAFDMAQFLVSTAGRPDSLDGALLLDECKIPLQECERLDENLALALHHLPLPPAWSLLGSKWTSSTDLSPQETLLHFSARRGLSRVTRFLLQQPGAREALQLANKEGHTPSAVAASRGHEHVHQILTKAGANAETDKATEAALLVSGEAWVFCHLPTLNTHTLTVKVLPGCEAPSFQKSVEHLLHSISHLHTKGVGVLELQLDSLHTAAECCDGVKTDLTCQEQLQQPCVTSPRLDTTTESSQGENNKVECSITAVCELGEIEKGWSLSSELRPLEHGLCPPQDQVCLGSSAEGEPTQTEQEGGAVSGQNLNLCDGSDGAEGEAGAESVTVGILAAASCGKHAEETDRGEAVIQEEQEAKKGEDQSEQEVEDDTARRKEESILESTPLITAGGDTNTSVMGQSLFSGSSEASDSSDSQGKAEDVKKDTNISQEDGGGVAEEDVGSEELTDPVSAPRDTPSPPPIGCSDVIEERESAAPCLLIEGLHEGEPPPDINSHEQNQETAGRNYGAEQQQGLASEAARHSGNCSRAVSGKELDGEDFSVQREGFLSDQPEETDIWAPGSASEDTQGDLNSEASPENMVTKKATDPELGVAHGHSSDDEGSFRSFGSSSTEVFNSAQDNHTVDEEDLLHTKVTEPSSTDHKTEDLNRLKPTETNEHPLNVESGLSLESGPFGEQTPSDCIEGNPEAESQPQMVGTTVDQIPELTKEGLFMEPVNKEASTENIGEVGESGSSELNIRIQGSTSELVPSSPGPWATEESNDDVPQMDTGDKPVGTEESGNVQCVLAQLDREDLDRTSDQRSAVNHLAVLLSQDASTESNGDSLPDLEVEPHVPNTEATADIDTENPTTGDVVGGVPHGFPGSSSTQQAVDVLSAGDAVSSKEEEENSPAEERDSSTIHRDGEASFHRPCSPHHSESSMSSAFPSLPSRTSSSTSCPSFAHRDSGSDIESLLNSELGYSGIFPKSDERVTGGDSASEVSVSCSSTDDTASVGPSSSSPEDSQGLGCSWSPEEGTQPRDTAGVDVGGGAGEAEEEAKDRVTEVPRRSCLFRNSIRSLSPPRRHSWGPGKNNGGEAELNQRSSIRSPGERKPAFHRRSYSLEGLSGVQEELRGSTSQGPRIQEPWRMPRHDSEDRVSLVSLTEEQEEREEHSRQRDLKLRRYRPLRSSCPSMTLPLTKSVSMVTISHKDSDGTRSFSSTSGSVAYSISEEEPGPLRNDNEGKSVTKVSRTFSYLKNKMYKKTKEKEREKKDKEGQGKDKKTVNGHLFTQVCSNVAAQCSQCNKALANKDVLLCLYCNSSIHKSCRDSLPVCAKVKMKLPKQPPAASDSSTLPAVTMRSKPVATRERPWSAILSPEDSSTLIPASRRHTAVMPFHGNNLSKSLSISNISGPAFDEVPIKSRQFLSQSTDSLNRMVTVSMESLADEGTEMMDGQLMGEYDEDAKELEADSWSLLLEQQYLQQLDKDLVKRQDVIYELMQTEMHHIRTLRIMSDVYRHGLVNEVKLEQQLVGKLFPVLDELLDLHMQYFQCLVERRRESKESQQEGEVLEGCVVISRIGDILVSQFSGSNGDAMKKVYGKFCSRHNEAVNVYKDLLTKDKHFKAFIKKKGSSSIVRRLGIQECILLVTQRITKYPVLFQRILQHTKENDEDYDDLNEAVRLVKEVIAAVDSKVNDHEKKCRLKEFHSRMDSKSIMILKSGQMFAKEDLVRRRLIHEGPLQLKNSQGRLKDVHSLLLSDVLVFLQEKDQKYSFAMLDQRSTVLSLQKLIVREVARQERGLFLITAGTEKPEMMEVLASSKEERNTWMQLIQAAMQSMEKDEDEGIPSETEDDKRQLETKAKEMRDMLRQKDTEIMSLLEEKVRLFEEMWEGSSPGEEACRQVQPFFRSACSQEPPRGASIMKDALHEVETLQTLVNGSLGGAMASVHEAGGSGPVCLPRRAETFGGFDSHQMHSSKTGGDRDESEDTAGELRRTESDSVLKKGGNANLLQLLKRNSEQVLHSVSNLHLLLSTLQAVVVQQDSYIEDQRQALSERSASCASLLRPSSRPGSLIEQEKQRSLEKHRQELTSLQRQQAAHAEERRRREREWERREQHLSQREALVHLQEEQMQKLQQELEEEQQELHSKKEEYQKDLERLRDAQRKLERDKDSVRRQIDKMEEVGLSERTPSTTSDESLFPGSSQSLELDPLELSSSSSSSLSRLQPQRSKTKGKGLNPFASTSSSLKGGEANNQISKSFLQLGKNKSKDGKKKKKSKGGTPQTADPQCVPAPHIDGEIFFC